MDSRKVFHNNEERDNYIKEYFDSIIYDFHFLKEKKESLISYLNAADNQEIKQLFQTPIMLKYFCMLWLEGFIPPNDVVLLRYDY